MTPPLTIIPAPSLKSVYAFLPLVVVTGFIQLLVPSTIHMIMNNFGIQPGIAGILPMVYFGGLLVSTLTITHLVSRYTIKQLMAVGALLASISLLLASQIDTYFIFVMLYLAIGFGNGLLMILPGLYSTHVFGEKSPELQSLIFATMAVGFVLGPVFPGIIAYLDLSWRWAFAFPGFLILPMLIPVILAKHEPIDHTEKLTLTIAKDIIKFDKRFFIGIIAVVSIGAGCTSGFLTWMITFLENNRGMDIGIAHIVLSIMGVATFTGRRMWGKVAANKRVYKTLLFIAPVSMFFIFIGPFPSNVIINIALFFMAIIFMSGINPLALSAAAIYPRSYSSSVYTILFSSAAVGGMAIPFGIGLIFQIFNATIGLSSIAILVLIIVIALLFIKKEIPLSEHIHRHLMP